MMDHEHDGGSNASENKQLKPSTESKHSGDDGRASNRASTQSSTVDSAFLKQRFQRMFSRETWRAIGERVHWPWIRSSSMSWLIGVAAAALFIQAVGLYNMLAVADQKQEWDASATQRQSIESELSTLQEKKIEAQQALVTAKASLDIEQTRLTELRAAIKIDQTLRDEAQRDHATASAEAKRLRQENETLASRLKDFSLRLETTERQVVQLESQRDTLAKDVAASKTILDEHRAEVAKATKHCQDLDKQAFATLAAIRTTRESLVKGQAELDAAVRETAKAEAQRDAALTRLKNAELLETTAAGKLAELNKQAADVAQKISQQQASLESVAASKTQAESALEAKQGELEAASKKLAESQGSLAAIKTHIDEATKSQQTLKAEQLKLTAAVIPLRDQQSSLAADIAQKKQELKAVLDQLQAAKQEAAKVVTEGKDSTASQKKQETKPTD